MSLSKMHLLLAAAAGALLVQGAHQLTTDDSMNHQVALLEDRIKDLEILLAKKEQELLDARLFVFDSEAPRPVATKKISAGAPAATTADKTTPATTGQEVVVTEQTMLRDQAVRDLITQTDQDPRSFTDKVTEFLGSNPSREDLAIASKGIYDLADNATILPDYALTSLYQNQTHPDIKRIAAQVMSMRGDNTLIEKQINEAQSGLNNPDPTVRQKTLTELAKTRYHSAANVIAPLLQDNDIGVKLDALLALRATGNESHVYLVENLVNHPDPSVSWLAKDVINELQMLSGQARTRIASRDIVAELPVVEAP